MICDRYIDSSVAYQGYGAGGIWPGSIPEPGRHRRLPAAADFSPGPPVERPSGAGDRRGPDRGPGQNFHQRVREATWSWPPGSRTALCLDATLSPEALHRIIRIPSLPGGRERIGDASPFDRRQYSSGANSGPLPFRRGGKPCRALHRPAGLREASLGPGPGPGPALHLRRRRQALRPLPLLCPLSFRKPPGFSAHGTGGALD